MTPREPSGYAERRARRPRADRAIVGGCRPALASRPATRGRGAPLLRRYVRGPDRRGDGHHQGRGEEPHLARDGRVAVRAGAWDMSHRRPDPSHPGLEQALRHALRVAADSVEPGADGLDRIHGKIAARPRVVHSGWQTTYLAGLLGVLSTVGRFADPAVIWLRYWTGAVAERFRPDLGRVGWLGWLRPAAAIATGLLVVAGASWAIAALPQAIAPSGNSRNYGNTGSGSSTPPPPPPTPPPGGAAPSRRAGPPSSPR